MKPVFHNIQALRGLAVLAVMLFHVQGIERKYSGDYLLPDALQLGAAGVDLFFLISGFIMMTVTRSLQPGSNTALHFLLQRGIRIYPLYWLVSALLLAVLLLKPDMFRNLPDYPSYIPLSFLLLPQPDLPLLSLGWTLIHEMYFYAVFSLLLLLPAHTHLPAIALWSACSLAGWLLLQPSQAEAWLYLLANPLNLEFAAGCAIAVILHRRSLPCPALLLALGILGAAGSWYFWSEGSPEGFPLGGARVACFLLPAALILAAAVQLEAGGTLFYPLLQRIGDASYSLYLTHILFLSLGGKIWQIYGDASSPVDNLLCLPLLLAVALLGGMAFHWMIEKPLLAWLRAAAQRR